MDKIIQRIFSLFGLTITRKRSGATGSRQTLEGALQCLRRNSDSIGFKPAAIIDVGVADGTPELYESFPESKFLLIEPLQEFEESLKKISEHFDAVYVVAAATATSGQVTIRITPDLAGSTIMIPTETSFKIKEREVPAVTVDSLVKQYGFHSPFMIKVDAQSSELSVLAGAIETMKDTEVVILEVPFFSFVENGSQFFEVMAFMKRYGFVVYDIVGHNYRPLDGALAEVDILFVKEEGIFRKTHIFASPDQRTEQFARPDPRF